MSCCIEYSHFLARCDSFTFMYDSRGKGKDGLADRMEAPDVFEHWRIQQRLGSAFHSFKALSSTRLWHLRNSQRELGFANTFKWTKKNETANAAARWRWRLSESIWGQSTLALVLKNEADGANEKRAIRIGQREQIYSGSSDLMT